MAVETNDRANIENASRVQHLTRVNRSLMVVVLFLMAGLVVVILMARSNSNQADELESAEEIALGLDSAVEAADADSVGAFFAEEALFEDPAAGVTVSGRAAVESMYGAFLSANSPITNTAIFIGPGFAVTEFVWTQRCTFVACSEPMFNQPIDVRGIVLHVIEDGMVIRETDYIAYPRNLVLP